MNMSFYQRIKPLSQLKEIQYPKQSDVEELRKFLHTDVYTKYFFHDLVNPKWIPLLHSIDFFMSPPELVEVKEGYFRLPIWYAGQYLSRFSDQYPDIIVEIAQNLSTNNVRVCSNIIRALSQLEPSDAVKAVNSVKNWLEYSFGDQLLHDLKRYMSLLVNNQYYEEALIVIAGLLKPTLQGADVTRSQVELRYVKVRPNYDDYWLKDIIRVYIPTLTKNIPIRLLTVMEESLDLAFELEQSALEVQGRVGFSSYWRSAIEDHPQNTSLDAYKDLLVDGIRDSLIEICSQDKSFGGDYISCYLSKEQSIFQRIALYLLRMFGENYSDILNGIFRDRAIFDDSSIHHELYKLLEDQFSSINENQQHQIIEWLLDGPSDIESVSQWIVKNEGPENLEEEVRKYCNIWTLRRIWAIREYLVGEDKHKFEGLVNEYGEPDHPDFLAWSSGVQDVARISPISQQKMLELSQEEIVQELKSYVPPSQSIVTSREGLAEILGLAVTENPQHFNSLSALLRNNEVPFIYIYHYLDAMKTALNHGKIIELDQIFDLCDYVVSEQHDPFDSEEWPYEAGLRAAQSIVADIIEDLLERGRKEHQQIAKDKIDRVRTIIDSLLHNSDPKEEDDLNSDWDPATRSLNCVRGKAMHDLIHLARYLDSKAKHESSEREHTPELDPFVMSKLEEKLDKSIDPSLSVHSVFGWYTPLLEYLDHEWLVAHLPQIFPEGLKRTAFWLAAWDAYVSFNKVYKRVFFLLLPHYHRAISLLEKPEESGVLGTTKGERLAEHLTYAYIYELIDIDSEDGLYESFYDKADDKLRGHVAFWLVRAFGELNLDEDSTIWKRMWNLWEWRFDNAVFKLYNDCLEEVSEYMRWLKHIPVGFEKVEPYVRATIPMLKEGYHKTLVIEYLVENCEHFPHQTVELLHTIIKTAESEWFSIREESAGKILSTVNSSGHKAAIDEAVLLINFLGERGDFRWKKYLPE